MTAHVKCLAMVWILLAALNGNGTATAADKTTAGKPQIPASKQPSPAKPQAAAVVAPAPEGEDGDGSRDDARGPAGGLPIPRFVSLRTNPINLRAGPGVRYPVDWVYVRRYLPVEVIDEFDTWRQIRDPAGAEGWVHQSMLSGKRTAVVTGSVRTLKRDGDEAA